MKNQLFIQSPEEDIEGQIDRLNFAVQRLMQGIELSSQTPRNPSQLSFTHPAWLDEEEQENSAEIAIPADLEAKFEEILLILDRTQMTNEDFWSEQYRRENTKSTLENDPYIIKLEKENMLLRSRQALPRNDFTLTLRRNSYLETEKRNFEEKLSQLDRLNEEYQARNQSILKVQESLKVKERWIDQKEKELRVCWQNFEKTKQEWEANKTNNLGFISKSPTRGPFIKQDKPMIVLKKEEFSLDQPELLTTHQGAPPPNAPETPSSRQKCLIILQNELKEFEDMLRSITDPVEHSKLVMKIDQIKNKIATIRGQMALFQSNRSSRLISNMMKTMEKEVSYEENKRKQQLEKYSKKTVTKAPENITRQPQIINNETTRRVISNDNAPLSNNSATFQTANKNMINQKLNDEKQLLDLRKEILNKREKELALRESQLQETWMKIPGSKELIEIVNRTLSKLTEQKNELDNEREVFEKEKVEMLKVRDKLMEQMSKIKN
ncbi:hypothetical protein SteCoe_18924 [Stentor coeruleus]|uniref:Uncharacterized protein n=1 Tax=Stentor coeruleus TaxID=5963 RepID=A0A1R2BW01_9CILI|nr:hypothetical protein SteCoe_18924 [Stentor coeruleus]